MSAAAQVRRWRHVVRSVAAHVLLFVRDRSIEIDDLESVGLIALAKILDDCGEDLRFVRRRLRLAMWDAVPRRRSPYRIFGGAEKWAADIPAGGADPGDIIDAVRAVEQTSGRAREVVLLCADGATFSEISETVGVSRTAARNWVRALRSEAA